MSNQHAACETSAKPVLVRVKVVMLQVSLQSTDMYP